MKSRYKAATYARPLFCLSACLVLATAAPSLLFAQQSPGLTWPQIRERFEQSNPTLLAGQLNIDESKAEEITAYLRPNPDLTIAADQIDPFTPNPYQPFVNTEPYVIGSYLHERRHKRELRLESAKKATLIAASQQEDLRRTLLFSLRGAFVQVLQSQAILAVAKDNLDYYDHVLKIGSDRLKAGDIAQVDLDRLELQRVQYESELETANVNLRTAKIQLLTLMNDRTPIELFDISGVFDFTEQVEPIDALRRMAIDARPDLKAAVEAIDKAGTDHRLAISNGSVDPTFSVDLGRNPPVQAYIGFSISIPLRIFDRNQGEKLRTEIDIRRTQRLKDAAAAQVFNDVDSAFATVNSNLTLLRPYKQKYMAQAQRVRDTITYAYQHGGASLLDFLSAQNDYRSVQLSYLNLIGSYLTAASQLNLAVGREVIP